MSATVKTTTLIAAFVLTAARLGAADGVLIVEKHTSAGTAETSQIQIEKTRMRAERGIGGRPQVIVFDSDAQVIRMIDPERKTYREMTKADVDRIASQMSGAMAQMQEQMKNLPPEQRERMEALMRGRGMAGAAAVKTEYRRNGTDKVGKWTCDKYDGYKKDEKVSEICTVAPADAGADACRFRDHQTGRPVLPAARAADRRAADVLDWRSGSRLQRHSGPLNRDRRPASDDDGSD